jgi:hypothetical protein
MPFRILAATRKDSPVVPREYTVIYVQKPRVAPVAPSAPSPATAWIQGE